MSAEPPRPAHGQSRGPSRRPDANPSRPSSPISPSRAAAFDILVRLGESGAHSDDLLHSPRIAALSQEDRNLATALVMGVLRWQIALDAQIATLLTRPGQQLAGPIAIALRMGAFQLLHMDRIPAHAAINESVELCRASGKPQATGMVNAILRKVVARGNSSDSARRRPIFESSAAFAERLGHPVWLVERWVAVYGRKAALAICEYDQREPQPGGLFPGAQSAAQIDDGSRLVAELAALVHPDPATVWDCCAAPGGKTLVLAERLPQTQIFATDIRPRRLERMKQRIAASPFAGHIQCEVLDVQSPDSAGLFDLVLCDAPCSGTGTLARNPEIRHRLRPEELSRQSARQRAILIAAIAHLAPGGRLLYSTCSLEPEENEQIVESVLARGLGVQQLSLEPALAQLGAGGILDQDAAALLQHTALRNGSLRTLPGTHPCDGFYAALLERN